MVGLSMQRRTRWHTLPHTHDTPICYPFFLPIKSFINTPSHPSFLYSLSHLFHCPHFLSSFFLSLSFPLNQPYKSNTNFSLLNAFFHGNFTTTTSSVLRWKMEALKERSINQKPIFIIILFHQELFNTKKVRFC